jgi:hypothetical protein
MINPKDILDDKTVKRAKISNNILKLADELYEQDNFQNRISAIILYLNLLEFYLGFLVRNLSLQIDPDTFINKPLGEKIKKLEKCNINEKERLLSNLKNINTHRIRIIHNIIEAIDQKDMSKSVSEIKKLFDDFNKIFILIVKSYGIT